MTTPRSTTDQPQVSDVEARMDGIYERLSNATDGPWRIEHTSQGDELVIVGKCLPEDEDDDLGVVARVPDMVEYSNPEDAEFIAHSREDIPWLLEQIDSIPAQVEAARSEEREACIAIMAANYSMGAVDIAAAIRARGENHG